MSDPFADFAKRVEDENKKKQSRVSGGGFQFEELNWTGLEQDRPKLIRAVGGAPDTNETPGTSITRRISWITGDDGKKFKCILPEKSEDEDHLLWKVISAIKETTYVNKVKVFIHENKNPELFRMVDKNGLEPTDKKAMFDNGWMGKTKFIMNAIDREQISWHKENKHTILLAKSVAVDGDRTYVDEGVPAYGFTNLLASGIFKFYKDWRNYDIAITKTGLKETPYRIINASKYFEELPSDLQPLVVTGPMTDEEKSWVEYDLKKLFKYTNYTKIYNKLKLSIQKIDARLGTRFDKMFQDAVEKETAEREENKQEEVIPDNTNDRSWNPMNDVVEAPSAAPAPAPTRSRTKVVEETPKVNFDTSILVGWSEMNDVEKKAITNAVMERGKLNISYQTTSELLKCAKCGIPSPDDFHACPACGEIF